MDIYEIKGHTLEYLDSIHCYVVDGVILPSITKILGLKFKDKYKNVKKEVLNKAAKRGTEVHNAIENYCKNGTESELREVKNFKFLKKQYKFEVLGNEIPIIIFDDRGKPIATGRLDLVLKDGEKIGLGDIKRTSVLDKEYLAYQLNLSETCNNLDKCFKSNFGKKCDKCKDNAKIFYKFKLYRIGYQQCYGTEIKFLKGLHLRNEVRKYIDIPINEKAAKELLNEYFKKNN